MVIRTYCLYSCVFILHFLFLGCSNKNFSEAPEYDTNLFFHTVKHYGENFSVIALWYTGSVKATGEIARYNPTLKSKTLKVGTKVKIPSMLIKRRTPLPKDFVRKALLSNPKKSQQTAPQTVKASPTPHKESTDQSPSSIVIADSPQSTARRRQVLQELLEE
jgi:hypothetical protein